MTKGQPYAAIGLLLMGSFVMPSSANQAPASSPAPKSLRLERSVVGSVLTSLADPPIRIHVNPTFKYVGGQRFILRDIADAEQHFFLEADGGKVIKRLYWIQFERFLAGHGGEYAYDSDQPLMLQGIAIRAHVRRFTEAPAADSDRRRAYDWLEQTGYVVPTPSARARLVYVPESSRRQEVMIIYIEPASAADLTAEESTAIIRRAMEGLSISR